MEKAIEGCARDIPQVDLSPRMENERRRRKDELTNKAHGTVLPVSHDLKISQLGREEDGRKLDTGSYGRRTLLHTLLSLAPPDSSPR